MSILDRLIGLKSGDENLQIDKLKYNFDTGARGNYFMVNIFGPQGIALEGWRCETYKFLLENWRQVSGLHTALLGTFQTI